MNNSTKDCPALMSDGRHATDYRPSCCVYDLVLNQNNLKSNHDARKFLQENAEQLMKRNSQYFSEKNSCNCKYSQVDPNGQLKFWANYQKKLGYVAKKQTTD